MGQTFRSYSFSARTAISVRGDTGKVTEEDEGDMWKPMVWNNSSGLKSGVVCRSMEDGGGGGGGGEGCGVGGGNGVVCSLFLCFLCFFFSCGTLVNSMGCGSTVTVAMMKKDARTMDREFYSDGSWLTPSSTSSNPPMKRSSGVILIQSKMRSIS